MWGGRAESERASSLVGRSKRGKSLGDSESRPSTDFRGISWVFSNTRPSMCCGESFLFFVEDVVKVSCPCSSRVAMRRIGSEKGAEAALSRRAHVIRREAKEVETWGEVGIEMGVWADWRVGWRLEGNLGCSK
jgi:hypothetical protein